MKTISELAKELNVTKSAVRRYLTEDVRNSYTHMVGGVIYVDETGESQIKSKFKSAPVSEFAESSGNDSANVPANVSGVSDIVSALVSTLQKQLEEKDRQIAEKDKQIADLIQSNLRLLPPPEPTPNAGDRSKASLWDRLFKRKN